MSDEVQLCLTKIQQLLCSPKRDGRRRLWVWTRQEGGDGKWAVWVLLWQRDFPSIPCLLRSGAGRQVHGRDFWCGQLGVWKDGETEKQVRGCEALVTQTDLQNLRCHLRGEVLKTPLGTQARSKVTECKGAAWICCMGPLEIEILECRGVFEAPRVPSLNSAPSQEPVCVRAQLCLTLPPHRP